jgi:hypothetical protein
MRAMTRLVITASTCSNNSRRGIARNAGSYS